MIKNIFFDLGGVILKHQENITEEIISKLFSASPNALEIYREHRLNLAKGIITAEESIFIDDKPGNVENAVKAGMIGIHYKNLEQLKEDLTKIISIQQ